VGLALRHPFGHSSSLAAMGSLLGDIDIDDEVSEAVIARRAQARQRQITIGKSRPEYKLYAGSVPYHQRRENMPHTPDPHARISKRAFDRELASWRRGLHVCAAQLEDSNGEPLKAPEDCGFNKDWSPAGTESTRADSEASSPMRSNCRAPAGQAKSWPKPSPLNLFEHLSAPQVQPQPPPAMTQMSMPAMPATGSWDMYSSGLNPASMMLPNAGSAPSGPMFQFAPVEQQQQQQCCPYGMPYACADPTPPWMQQPAPQVQPQVMPLAPQVAPQALPTDSSSSTEPNSVETQMSQQGMWQPAAHQRRLSPRPSKVQKEEAPRTPRTRTMRGVTSPTMASPSPWNQMRTPSPGPQHYHMTDFQELRAPQQQQQQAPAPQLTQGPSQGASLTNPEAWVAATLMVAVQTYASEADGYLSFDNGTQVNAMIDNPHLAGANCKWPTYVYCCQGSAVGWVPQQILWRCFVDSPEGRRWACDDATGTWCWVDQIEKNGQSIAAA